MKHTRILTLLLCMVLLLTACGSNAPTGEMDMALDNGYYAPDGEYGRVPGETMAASELKSDSAGLTEIPAGDRKLIKTVTINAETEHYDDLIPALDEKIIALGGYVESRETGSYTRDRRWSRMTVRIPA